MDILDNANIVRNLSDPTLWGSVLSEAKGLIKMVEYLEEINDIEHKLHKSTHTSAYENFILSLESLSRQWSESLKLLHLGDLDKWIINDSVDINQLEFRLRQIKCRLGSKWNKEEANRLHTDLLYITERFTDVIINLEENAFLCMYDMEAMVDNASHDAWHIVKFLSKWLRDVISIQDYMQKIIEGAESILNPQPTQTETEPQVTIKVNNPLPPELDTPDAHKIWNKARANGWINQDYSFNGTQYQMTFAAETMALSLGIKDKWKNFCNR